MFSLPTMQSDFVSLVFAQCFDTCCWLGDRKGSWPLRNGLHWSSYVRHSLGLNRVAELDNRSANFTNHDAEKQRFDTVGWVTGRASGL